MFHHWRKKVFLLVNASSTSKHEKCLPGLCLSYRFLIRTRSVRRKGPVMCRFFWKTRRVAMGGGGGVLSQGAQGRIPSANTHLCVPTGLAWAPPIALISAGCALAGNMVSSFRAPPTCTYQCIHSTGLSTLCIWVQPKCLRMSSPGSLSCTAPLH